MGCARAGRVLFIVFASLVAAAAPAPAQCATGWIPLAPGDGPDARVTALCTHDFDGDGPEPPRLVAGGWFMNAGGVPARNITAFDGAAWHALGPGALSWVFDLLSFDPDGQGPAGPELVASGHPRSSGPPGMVLRWSGQEWQALDAGFTSHGPEALEWFDLDGPGPLPSRLIAAGSFSWIGGVLAQRVAAWDGAGWAQVGAGFSDRADALVLHDFDGEGPEAASLVAGGRFLGSAVPAPRVARWTGSAWASIGPGIPAGAIFALASFDPDGPGPTPPDVIAAGSFSFASPAGPVANVARWDGAEWSRVGAGAPGTVRDLAVVDTDGPGPVPPRLFAVGEFPAVRGWDGAAWTVLPGGLSAAADAAAGFDPDGAGPQHAQLCVGGSFLGVGFESSPYVARWGESDAPSITAHPADRGAPIGGDAHFVVEAAGEDPLSYRWRRGGVDLADGATPWGSLLSGAGSPTLTLAGARPEDAGHYDAVVSNACGAAACGPALLIVLCPADWNQDQATTSADISAFLGAWLISLQTGTLDADYNDDGSVDSSDISAFLAAWLADVQGPGC